MREYDCYICGGVETDFPKQDDEIQELGICTDCWFKRLLGKERAAIGKRVDA